MRVSLRQSVAVVLSALLALESALVAAMDPGWPREVGKDGATLVYYQPQIEAWKDQRELTARMAFALTPKGGKQVIGVASLRAKTQSDVDTRTVVIKNIEVLSTRFPSLDAQGDKQMGAVFRKTFPTAAVTISLDRLVASVEQKSDGIRPMAVRNDPPTIFVSDTPAILLIVDGEPVRAPIEGTKLAFVVNTNWDIFFNTITSRYYLLNGNAWLTANALEGPWSLTHQLPTEMSAIPAGENWADVKQNIPPRVPGSSVQVFFSKTPAELIVLRGPAVNVAIPGTRLVYVKNTDADLFVQLDENQYYYLVSGRWFRTKALTGPWTYAGNDLPKDFLKIPVKSPKEHVLTAIPGTEQAADAVLLAQVPTMVSVNRAEAEAKVKVAYDGDPTFKPIEQTSLSYATNTQDKVIKVGDLYYLCFQGVWFMSTKPTGPWKTTDIVPKEIYTIPASSPVHNVTYVYVYESTPTTVECGHTSGYVGMFVVGAMVGMTIAYGTGYYYPPYIYYGRYPYPIYRPYPVTYGYGAVYYPYGGGWRATSRVYGPYGTAGRSAWYNPATGRYGRSATVQTPYGGRTVAQAYNPYTGAYAATRQGSSPYAQWGSSVAQRGDDWVRSQHVTTSQGTVRTGQTSQGGSAVSVKSRSGSSGFVAQSGNNNVYAGKDGNVYKNTGNGWQQYQNGSWNTVQPPPRPTNTTTAAQSTPRTTQTTGSRPTSSTTSTSPPTDFQSLNQDAAARQRGSYNSQRAASSTRSSGTRSGSRSRK